MCQHLLNTAEVMREHVDALVALEPQFGQVTALLGLPSLRTRPVGFTQLYQTIVSQQLSTSAANSIWAKLNAEHLLSETAVLNAEEALLKRCGLSKQKIRYIKSLANEHIDYAALVRQSDEQVVEVLTKVLGIGRWTAEIYLLFSLNRSDVFAANDLALQAATQHLFTLKERPQERIMRKLAANWSPYRSAAAYLLWGYYGYIKKR